MSGQRAPAHEDFRDGVRPNASRRVRVLAAIFGLLSVAAFGAVAGAAGAPDPPEPDPTSHLKAATTETSEPEDSASVPDTAVEVSDTPPSDPPEGLGDDPDLDALAQGCYDGDLVACDLLYLQSPVDSDYEEYGDTCAGRQEAGTENYCGLVAGGSVGPDETLPPESTEPIVSGPPVPPDNLGDDPELDALAEACYVGDMDSCDDLYFGAEEGSDYRVYGDTCGGRQPEGTGRLCVNLQDPVPGNGEVSTPTTAVQTTEIPDTTEEPVDVTTTTEIGPGTTEPIAGGEVPPPSLEPTGLGDDPQLDALAQSCYDGDMASCDDLYRSSEPGSDYRSYGDTCAGRQAEDTGVWCSVAFGGDDTTTTTGDQPPTTDVGATSSTTPLPGPDQSTVPPVPESTQPTQTTAGPVSTAPPTTLPPGATTTVAAGSIPPPTLEPTGLGTDPTLDGLAQSCFDGDMQACDDLYRQSEVDTPYRNYGDTCAGRQPPFSGTWCVVSFPGVGDTTTSGPAPTTSGPTTPGPTTPGPTTPGPTTPASSLPQSIPAATQQPTGLGDDPTLNALAQSCYDGDMQACDDLFDQSDIGSAYQTYGDTCAGRQPEHTFNYCHVVFPGGPRRPS